MRKRSLRGFLPSSLALMSATFGATAHAAIVGSTVTGSLYGMGATPGAYNTALNAFDPASGTVPAGYGNSLSNIVTVTDPGIEFAAIAGGGTLAAPGVASYTVDLTNSTLTIHEVDAYPSGIGGFQVVLADPSFAGLMFTKTSDTFATGGFTESLVGDTLTLSVGPNCVLGTGCIFAASSTATWSVSPVPLPATAWLMLSGLGGLIALARGARLH
jgi:hypothetical protein